MVKKDKKKRKLDLESIGSSFGFEGESIRVWVKEVLILEQGFIYCSHLIIEGHTGCPKKWYLSFKQL